VLTTFLRVPEKAARQFSTLPSALQEKVLTAACNLVFKSMLDAGEMSFLRGNHLYLSVTDIPCCWLFRLHKRGLTVKAIQGNDRACVAGHAYVEISASWAIFCLLALGEVDPDTLFFKRKLLIEGDTELGLEVKNFLDRMEWPRYSSLNRVLRASWLNRLPLESVRCQLQAVGQQARGAWVAELMGRAGLT